MVTLFRNLLNAHRPIHVNATYLCIFKFTLTKHRMINIFTSYILLYFYLCIQLWKIWPINTDSVTIYPREHYLTKIHTENSLV